MAAVERKSQPAESKDLNMESEQMESEESEPLFEVETIIGKSKFKGQIMYKVRWKGYGQEDDTWEPVENLSSCQDLIEEYNEKLAEINRKRAEQRKMKRLEMEGRISTDSSDSCNESPYPATFKNTFWKELEAGRVNVFENDMYSSVKKRSVEQATKQDRSQGESSPEQRSSSNSSRSRSASKNSRKGCSAKTSSSSKCSTKCDRSSSSASSTSNKISSSKCQQTSEKTSRTSSPNKKQANNSKNFDLEKAVILTDSETDTEFKSQCEIWKEKSDQESDDSELTRPSFSLVIRKVPVADTESSQSCSFVLHNSPTNMCEEDSRESNSVIAQKPLSDNSVKDGTSERKSSSKKKKKKKHKTHRKDSERSRESRDTTESARKRKVASTSLSSLPSESSLRCERKMAKLETDNKVVDNVKVTNHCLRNPAESSLYSAGQCSEDCPPPHTGSYQSISPTVSSSPAVVSECTNITTADMPVDGQTENNTYTSKVSSLSSSSSKSFSNDLNLQTFDRSQSKLDSSMSDISNRFLLGQDLQVPLFGDLPRNPPAGKCDLDRQDSETVDSGIASPASERSEQSSSRKPGNPHLDDLFGKTVLPLLLDCEKPHSRGAEQLEIDLDDVDWKMFDIDVKLEPITLSNNDFASAVVRGDLELVKRAVLGNGKYDLERPDLSGKTLLMHAVNKMYDDIADLLINQGAKIDAQMNTGYTPLMIACEHAEVSTVNLLLELGAKVNLHCRNGESALMKAAKRGHSQIVWLLLECGANFNMVSNSGYTALSFVKLLRYEETASIIINHTQRVMSEFDRQVALTLNNSAKILSTLFSPQVYNLCEEQKFQMVFKHSLQPPNSGVGYLLFIGHALFTSEEIKVRLYGACAVEQAELNGFKLSSLTKESTNFVLAFSPLMDGRNVLTINTVKAPDVKAKLIVCAYKAQLLQP